MRCRILTFLTLTSLTVGCQNDEQERNQDYGIPTSRGSRNEPHSWLDGPQPSASGSPSANTWNDPDDPNYDFEREARGLLAGTVVMPDGRKVKGVYIEVSPDGDGANRGAPIGVVTDETGHFLIKGLEPRSRYTLTASTPIDGVDYNGQVYAQTSEPKSQTIQLTLVQGLILPPERKRETPPPSNDKPIPPPVMPQDRSDLPDPIVPTNALAPASHSSSPHPADGAFSPVAPSDNGVSPQPTRSLAPRRPDLVTEGPKTIERPPTTSIPNPNRQQSNADRSRNDFVLLDTTGKPKTFANGGRDLILLDFMATWCSPCTKAIPTLKRLQSDYESKGVQVVGLLCDEQPTQERLKLAARYSETHRLNYPVMVEPAAKPGALQARYEVRGYPTLILLDGNGEVLWRGHPKDEDQLRRVLAEH